MYRIKFHFLILFTISLTWIISASPLTVVLAQETQASPTPQASSTGITATILYDEPFVNVRVGPSASTYPVIGKLFPGDVVPAYGRSPGGDWIQVEFPGGLNNRGWVYSAYVSLSPGTLQIAEPPPTPIPPPTSTIDPTLAAQFSILPTNTRLPTFTPPAPLTTPVAYTQPTTEAETNSVPMAIVILSFAGFGIIGFVISLLIPRRY